LGERFCEGRDFGPKGTTVGEGRCVDGVVSVAVDFCWLRSVADRDLRKGERYRKDSGLAFQLLCIRWNPNSCGQHS
jgi:hypothetical protein